MIHPAFIAAARHPGLMLDHASAYADLASAELDEWRLQWQRRASLGAAAALLAYLSLALLGGAGLALAVVPLASMPLPWLLIAVPAVPLLLAMVLAWRVRRLAPPPPFAELRQQLAQDMATLRILESE